MPARQRRAGRPPPRRSAEGRGGRPPARAGGICGSWRRWNRCRWRRSAPRPAPRRQCHGRCRPAAAAGHSAAPASASHRPGPGTRATGQAAAGAGRRDQTACAGCPRGRRPPRSHRYSRSPAGCPRQAHRRQRRVDLGQRGARRQLQDLAGQRAGVVGIQVDAARLERLEDDGGVAQAGQMARLAVRGGGGGGLGQDFTEDVRLGEALEPTRSGSAWAGRAHSRAAMSAIHATSSGNAVGKRWVEAGKPGLRVGMSRHHSGSGSGSRASLAVRLCAGLCAGLVARIAPDCAPDCAPDGWRATCTASQMVGWAASVQATRWRQWARQVQPVAGAQRVRGAGLDLHSRRCR